MTRVKVCGVTRFDDCEVALDAGADALGFVMEAGSPRRLHDASLPAAVGPLALCVSVYGVYLPGTEVCPWVQCSSGTPDAAFIRAVRLRPESTVESVLAQLGDEISKPAAVLLDAFDGAVAGGTGRLVDWGLAAELVQALPLPVILAGGLGPENVGEAVRKVRPYGVDASSGLEVSPGIKSHERVRAFVLEAKGA
ncbi:MAG: phosphoribosylanthranilate isomerase [Fimbriimonadaceae bacterium]|nr:phosphoribosylanthranilate isomerase [Fimbriimonadaceae bacterium]